MRSLVTKGLLASLLFMLAGAGLAHAQRTVTGTVTDAESGFPLPGVNIQIQGTTTGTITGIDGNYSLEVPGPEAVLLFSFVGYQTQEVAVGDQEVIDVAMGEDALLLDDIVVVGYGTQRREDVTGSVASIDVEDANVGLVTSPDQMIQGRVAGVNITSTNGEPGAGLNIRIRGGTSISASNEPLYVIDGVPIDNAATTAGGSNVSNSGARNPLNLINPNDIESISILKDASAAAIYGSRGANGVVLITTKRGAEGSVMVDYEGYVSASNVANELDLLSASEFRNFVQDNDLSATLGNTSTDWQDAVTRTGVSHFHNLAFSGGATNTTYRASLSYLSQEGAVISSGLERVTGRVNANHSTLDDRLRLGLNLQASFIEDDFLPYQQTGGFEGGLFTNVFAFNPTQPIRNEDGTFYEIGPGRQSVRNPVALAEQVQDFAKTTRALGNISAELDLVEGLTAQVNFGADRSQSTRRQYFPKSSPVGAEFGGQAIQGDLDRTSVTFQSYLTYRASFAENNNFDILGGYEFNEFTNERFGAEGRGFISDAVGFNNIGGAENLIPGSCFDGGGTFSCKIKSRLISFFSRANYNYDDRYYLTGVVRYDGSSRFGSGNKWALFPAVSASWRISEESFLSNNSTLTDLRLRVGYGVVGNQEIGDRLSLELLAADPNNRAILGGQVISGVALANYPNPNLQWEETATFNIGLDYGFLSGRFSGTLEYYLKNTTDLLLDIPVPQPAPLPTRLENVGETRNQGVEFSLDALAIDKPDLSMTLGIVLNANRNEVVSLGTRDQIITGTVSGRGQSGVFAQVIRPGEPLGSFFGPVFAGVVDGVQTYEDLDGDGVVEPTGDDRTIIGTAQPDFTFGFRSNVYWKNFDAAVFFRGEVGRDLFNNTALVYRTKSSLLQSNNLLAEALDDPDAIPEAPFYSSRWIEDGTFLRLENVTIGYTIDTANLTSRLRNARVYVSGQNLFVLTDYSGFDPEVNTNAGLATLGIDYTNYPRSRTFTLGVSLGI